MKQLRRRRRPQWCTCACRRCARADNGADRLCIGMSHAVSSPSRSAVGRSAQLWIEAEVNAVLASEAAGATNEELRELVQQLVAARRARAGQGVVRPADAPA